MIKAVLSGLLFIIIFTSCKNDKPLFKRIAGEKSGIHFNNLIQENDSINPLDLEFLYNGGGVAVGDFNNDNLPDLYFTASTQSNKLYLNKGDLKFIDVTTQAKVSGNGAWSNGATVVDINNDGRLDIYVCTTIKSDPSKRKNLLFINNGNDKNNVPVFTEMAHEYGLDDTSFSVQAAFADFDNDGDLDMYLVTTKLAQRNGANIDKINVGDKANTDVDKLYQNNWNDSLKHPVFTDISKAAGITEPGFGLGITVSDINKDGWLDIYVTNDYFNSDHLYINNKDGTFTNKVKECFKHTSQNAMGNDIADINNDGLPDIIAVDMNPEDNFRKKKNMNSNNYYITQKMQQENIMLQYVRNTLQLNMGSRVLKNDSIGEPIFSDISFYAGVAETDWSWNPSIADFNNDGNRDIIITNGYPRDVTDHDFLAFRARSSNVASKEQLIDQIPQIKINNYVFENKGNLKFENNSAKWGFTDASFSNGAVYVDLDNDGDLDYVINNINEEAFLYENTLNQSNKKIGNFINIKFKGSDLNINGLGASAQIFYNHTQYQYAENLPVRGYLSCVDDKVFFGLDTCSVIDSLIIKWPTGQQQILRNIKGNQQLQVDIKNAGINQSVVAYTLIGNPFFTDITSATGINYVHQENEIIDFDRERLLPHKLSQYGPGLAATDINGDGLDDICVGGTGDRPGKFFIQQPNGTFKAADFSALGIKDSGKTENMGILFFDANNDGFDDIYIAAGSNEFEANSPSYQDQFYLNDGHGKFINATNTLPVNYTSKSCVKAIDYDNDGDLDLFIGGRSMPGKYPQKVSSFIYRNDLNTPQKKMVDVTNEVAKDLQNIGMVCDAIWTDFDNDGAVDLILAGEWMPLTFLKNTNGKFINITASTGIGAQTGWWNSIVGGDFDNDGDIDYIAGNLGENSFFKASAQFPVSMYVKDIDHNGQDDAIMTIYLKDQAGNKKEFTAANRDDIMSQIPSLKKKFLTYKDFGKSDFSQIFSPEDLKDAQIFKATNFASCYIENKGNGKFEMHALPPLAQMAPVNGMVTDDFNHDGFLDIVLCGNDYGNETVNGQYDAMNGLLLLGNGSGGFKAQTILKAGMYIPADAKALIKLRAANGAYLMAASQNNGALKIFKFNGGVTYLQPKTITDKFHITTLPNGKKRKEEFYYGTSFLSQSARFILVTH